MVATLWEQQEWTSPTGAVAGLVFAYVVSVAAATLFYRFVEEPATRLSRRFAANCEYNKRGQDDRIGKINRIDRRNAFRITRRQLLNVSILSILKILLSCPSEFPDGVGRAGSGTHKTRVEPTR